MVYSLDLTYDLVVVTMSLKILSGVWASLILFFTDISETMLPTKMYCISLERLFYSASAHVCCMKIHAKVKELLQFKD